MVRSAATPRVSNHATRNAASSLRIAPRQIEQRCQSAGRGQHPVAFVADAHRPENLAVVVGDFNVPAHDPTQGLRPDRWYLDLASRMARLGLVDAFWLDGQRQLVLVRRDSV